MHVWIVERSSGKEWRPLDWYGARSEARDSVAYWNSLSLFNTRFRVRKYMREEDR